MNAAVQRPQNCTKWNVRALPQSRLAHASEQSRHQLTRCEEVLPIGNKSAVLQALLLEQALESLGHVLATAFV